MPMYALPVIHMAPTEIMGLTVILHLNDEVHAVVRSTGLQGTLKVKSNGFCRLVAGREAIFH